MAHRSHHRGSSRPMRFLRNRLSLVLLLLSELEQRKPERIDELMRRSKELDLKSCSSETIAKDPLRLNLLPCHA
jgi:hypothetical protein